MTKKNFFLRLTNLSLENSHRILKLRKTFCVCFTRNLEEGFSSFSKRGNLRRKFQEPRFCVSLFFSTPKSLRICKVVTTETTTSQNTLSSRTRQPRERGREKGASDPLTVVFCRRNVSLEERFVSFLKRKKKLILS
jgi:hypothetical protein